ncbi:MAG: LicD family protein [Ruminococcaceae bacterium]|nr:LicD family protein [Oscillospiraceae bacterium]
MSDLLRQVQLTQYEILKELDRVAKKHNIRYVLGQGTLLGAVKYKKFIPWDDDIDLLIPYKELKKLIGVFESEADKKYKITNCFIERHFPVAWSKIRNTETLSRPKRYKELPINWGICIDLFPVYSLSNIGFVRKIEYILYKIAAKLLVAEFTKFEEGHGLFVRLLEKIPICIRHLFFKFIIYLLSLHSDNTEYVMTSCKGAKVVKRSLIFGGEESLLFEDEMFPAPKGYHEYLTINYGDYMADLPEELRKGHDLTLGDIEWKI